MDRVLYLLSPDFLFRDALLASLIVGFVCPWVGVYFLLRRIVFLGIALPQISSVGIALAVLGHNLGWIVSGDAGERWLPLVGSLAATIPALLAFAILSTRHSEARIGAAFVLAGALGVLIVVADPVGEARSLALLKGDVLLVDRQGLEMIAIVCSFVLLGLIACHRELLLVSSDPDIAVTLGRSVLLWQLVLFSLVGLAISAGVIVAGPVVTFGYLLLPPLAAVRIARGVLPLCLISSAFGAASALAGFYTSYRWNLPVGPCQVVAASSWLLIGSIRLRVG